MRTTKAQLEQIINDRTRQFEEQRLVAIKLQDQLAIANARLAMFTEPVPTSNDRRAAMSSAREAAILGKRVVLVSP